MIKVHSIYKMLTVQEQKGVGCHLRKVGVYDMYYVTQYIDHTSHPDLYGRRYDGNGNIITWRVRYLWSKAAFNIMNG